MIFSQLLYISSVVMLSSSATLEPISRVMRHTHQETVDKHVVATSPDTKDAQNKSKSRIEYEVSEQILRYRVARDTLPLKPKTRIAIEEPKLGIKSRVLREQPYSDESPFSHEEMKSDILETPDYDYKYQVLRKEQQEYSSIKNEKLVSQIRSGLKLHSRVLREEPKLELKLNMTEEQKSNDSNENNLLEYKNTTTKPLSDKDGLESKNGTAKPLTDLFSQITIAQISKIMEQKPIFEFKIREKRDESNPEVAIKSDMSKEIDRILRDENQMKLNSRLPHKAKLRGSLDSGQLPWLTRETKPESYEVYDAQGNKIRIVVPSPNVEETYETYDSKGNKVRVKIPITFIRKKRTRQLELLRRYIIKIIYLRNIMCMW